MDMRDSPHLSATGSSLRMCASMPLHRQILCLTFPPSTLRMMSPSLIWALTIPLSLSIHLPSTPFSQFSSYYTYAGPHYTLSSGRTPFSSPCLFPQDYAPTSPVNFQ
ncbi:hypothetical protein AMELA_G00037400 [Ameiurus melas]|uniref:Uncharacterized protein n=1 Tax=Ameiurus melas TaxID=219545 RepID=A0A7J6BCK3_AMEME|nr:hypothetical protein AMELA_G00037400 [Ameiurus melas]